MRYELKLSSHDSPGDHCLSPLKWARILARLSKHQVAPPKDSFTVCVLCDTSPNAGYWRTGTRIFFIPRPRSNVHLSEERDRSAGALIGDFLWHELLKVTMGRKQPAV